MTITRAIATLVLSAGVLGAPGVRAESAIPDPAVFFAGLVNPDAIGQKVTGFLTIAYDFAESDDPDVCPSVIVNNMFVVTTMQYRKELKPFNRDFIGADGTEHETPFCFDSLDRQINFVVGLLKEEVIPHFFQCVPGATCPAFEIKSMKSFLSSGTGAVSTTLRLAVKRTPVTAEDTAD